jgi:RimJ/RimL family protein N-acetyltransferase
LDLQPQNLYNNLVEIVPLQKSYFEALFQAASDELTWNQHPNPLRYQLSHFQHFFEGAIFSQGAFIIKDKGTKYIIGSTRFYNYNENQKSIYIGYTFIAREYWGKGYNLSVKIELLKYAFLFLEKVYFQIGATNLRSQSAIAKLGAIKIKEEMVEYYKEKPKLNYLYLIEKLDFHKQFKLS